MSRDVLVEIDDASFRYAHSPDRAGVAGAGLHVAAGEVVALVGPSGCGKTTMTRIVNGLVPHHFDGESSGATTVTGLDVAETGLAALNGRVGSVFQSPRSQFFTTDVTSELAFGSENLGREPERIGADMARVAARLGIGELLGRSMFTLSGGQRQKVACAAAWVAGPRVMVLDEPTANLDDHAVAELRAVVAEWKRDGCAVVVAEHRLHWLMGLVDRWLVMKDGRIAAELDGPALAELEPDQIAGHGLRSPAPPILEITTPHAAAAGLTLRGLRREYRSADRPALDLDELRLPAGSITAITGPNGAGKSTLARGLVGLDSAVSGEVVFEGSQLAPRERRRVAALVLQDVEHQLFADSVLAEVLLGSNDADEDEARAVLADLGVDDVADRHPLSLSGGQKQRVAIAAAVLSGRRLLVLDEPTSGLDRTHMLAVSRLLEGLARRGLTVLVVTHDAELVNACCTRLVRLEGGRVQATGEVVAGTSP